MWKVVYFTVRCMVQGIVGTEAGTLWYVNWTERASIRLVSGHPDRINALALCEDLGYLATCSQDGSLRVWSVNEREQTLQFQVMEQVRFCMWMKVLISFNIYYNKIFISIALVLLIVVNTIQCFFRRVIAYHLLLINKLFLARLN